MTDRPDGVVTFLFTDIEGSTRRWEADADAMAADLAAHDETLRGAVEAHGGWLFKHTGDGVCAVFGSPDAALHTAVAAQRELALPVRMGIATGGAERRGDDYFGPTLNQVARLMACGHGGQVLVAGSTAGLVHGFDLLDLGEQRLRDLAAPVSVRQLVADGLGRDFPPLRGLAASIGNLPKPTTALLGRDEAVGVLADALGTAPLVTLVGVGGVGKTRLALEVANEVAGGFPDGAWLVELAPVLEDDEVAEAVASVFAVLRPPDGDWAAAVADALAARRLLLVLDNCEHVLGGATALAEGLVARAPEVRVLCTSREGLGVPGESLWPVPSLDTGPGSAASALFVARAAAAAPEVDLGDQLDQVEEICRRLDGIPLAIELAAARVRSLGPDQIRAHLDQRFRLLTGGRRSAERHQTLRQAVQWSYDLLGPSEAAVLDVASVFAGGFDLDAATAVCGSAAGLDELDVLDALDSLVNKSLLQVDRHGPSVRYELLETIRQFSEERLAGSGLGDSARDRHAAHFADRAEGAFGRFRGPDERDAYRFVDDEIANLRAAFEWAAEADDVVAEAAVRIAACTHEIARFRLRGETFDWPGRMVDHARRTDHRLLPLLLTMACDSAWAGGQLEQAKALGREAVAVADDERFEAFVWAYTDLAQIAFFEGDADTCLDLLRTGAQHPADGGDRFVLALSLLWSALIDRPMPAAEVHAAVERVTAGGFPTAIACALTAEAGLVAGRDSAAYHEITTWSLDLLRSCGNRLVEQNFWSVLAERAAAEGDRERALSSFASIVDAWRVRGDAILASGMVGLALFLADLGDLESAAHLLGAVARTVALATAQAARDRLRAELGDAAFDAAFAAGAAMDHDSSADLARAAIERARAALAVDGSPPP